MPLIKNKKTVALLAAISANFIWGMGGFTIKIAAEEIGTDAYIAARFFIVTLLLLPWAIKYFPKGIGLTKWILLLFVGLIAGPGNYFLVVNGIAATNLSSAAFILLAEPIIAFLLAGWLLGERLSKKMKTGLFIVFSGALLITFGSAGLAVEGVSIIGNLLLLGVIALSALDLVLAKKIMKQVSLKFLLWLMAFLTSVTVWPLISLDQLIPTVIGASAETQLSLAWGIIMNTFIAYYCYYFAIQALEAGEAGMIRYVDPTIGILVGFLILGEPFSIIYVIGGAMVAYGIYMAESSSRKFHIKHFWHRHHRNHRKHHHILHRT